MDQNEERLRRLLEGHLQNRLTEPERDEFFTALRGDEHLLGRLTAQLPLKFSGSEALDTRSGRDILDAIFKVGDSVREGEKVGSEDPEKVRVAGRRVPMWRWGWAAAALLILVMTGIYIASRRPAGVTAPPAVAVNIPAGVDKAVLTLGDGSTVVLDSAGRRDVAQGATAVHQEGGQLRYEVQGASTAVLYNTLTTPRGGQFQVRLPDGTRAWLNAASSLRYPTAFKGAERRVEVTGEAYFEVAKNTQMPFVVRAGGMEDIEVLGTSFNINAYTDEPEISTSLIEGVVKVRVNGQEKKLAPGQQVRADRTGAVVNVVDHADMDQAVAWKNGIFNFNQTDIRAMMRQIGRWYDVEIVYPDGIPSQESFAGEMQRSLSLDKVLKGLENMGVRCRIDEHKRIVVLP